ncbi:MAG TPA: crossover junction endodeoxyribonuclease RuvC [Treponemataceae bacterium]|nr:crossover junction endodeoxyribonuclease RuvC [Treponemataceae bacterium]HPS44721.1 crossover junction endodeoxyribonuclease RuvC [Treponemataceae bacterium]
MKKPSPGRIVLGIDPGLASTGYGIVAASGNRISYVTHGVIETSPKTARPERLLAIFREISAVIERYAPTEAGMETLYFAKNVTSAMAVAEARGVVTLALALHGIALGEYTPHGIKQAVVGVARAEKAQVQESVRILLGLPEIPKPDHAADALAAAITRLNTVDIASLACQSAAKRG